MQTDHELKELGEEWATAELNADTDFLDRLLTDDYIGIGPFGFLLTREQWLDRHLSGDLKYSSFAWSDPQIRVYGDTAVVIGIQTGKATHQGQEVPFDTLRTTHIFVRQNGSWRLAGLQMSLMGPPGSYLRPN